jgi:hypothetical protein
LWRVPTWQMTSHAAGSRSSGSRSNCQWLHQLEWICALLDEWQDAQCTRYRCSQVRQLLCPSHGDTCRLCVCSLVVNGTDHQQAAHTKAAGAPHQHPSQPLGCIHATAASLCGDPNRAKTHHTPTTTAVIARLPKYTTTRLYHVMNTAHTQPAVQAAPGAQVPAPHLACCCWGPPAAGGHSSQAACRPARAGTGKGHIDKMVSNQKWRARHKQKRACGV